LPTNCFEVVKLAKARNHPLISYSSFRRVSFWRERITQRNSEKMDRFSSRSMKQSGSEHTPQSFCRSFVKY